MFQFFSIQQKKLGIDIAPFARPRSHQGSNPSWPLCFETLHSQGSQKGGVSTVYINKKVHKSQYQYRKCIFLQKVCTIKPQESWVNLGHILVLKRSWGHAVLESWSGILTPRVLQRNPKSYVKPETRASHLPRVLWLWPWQEKAVKK